MNEQSSRLPSTAELAAMTSPEQVEAVLARPDLADASVQWWAVLISVCNTGLVSTESGADNGKDWGAALIGTLDKGRETGVLGLEQTLHRKLMAEAALLHYFGPSAGDPVLDPERMYTGFLDDIGMSREELLGAHQELQRELTTRRGDAALMPALIRLSRIKDALGSLKTIAGHLTNPALRHEAEEWAALADRMK
jgi:hypothetical protein